MRQPQRGWFVNIPNNHDVRHVNDELDFKRKFYVTVSATFTLRDLKVIYQKLELKAQPRIII